MQSKSFEFFPTEQSQGLQLPNFGGIIHTVEDEELKLEAHVNLHSLTAKEDVLGFENIQSGI